MELLLTPGMVSSTRMQKTQTSQQYFKVGLVMISIWHTREGERERFRNLLQVTASVRWQRGNGKSAYVTANRRRGDSVEGINEALSKMQNSRQMHAGDITVTNEV